jgi:hypothetical protein
MAADVLAPHDRVGDRACAVVDRLVAEPHDDSLMAYGSLIDHRTGGVGFATRRARGRPA